MNIISWHIHAWISSLYSPGLQVLEKALGDKKDNTQFTVIFANQSPKDILLKEHLDRLASAHSNRLRMIYVVDRDETGSFKGHKGHVDRKLLDTHLPKPGADSFVYVCGPPGFMNLVSGNKNMKDFSQGDLTGLLKDMRFNKDNVFKF